MKRLQKFMEKDTKLMIANGIFMSKILYMLPVIARAPAYLLNELQRKQNEMMRLITNEKWELKGKKLTSTKKLLNKCNWLSIKQLAQYTTISSIHMVIINKTPVCLSNKLTSNQAPITRNQTKNLPVTAESEKWTGPVRSQDQADP